MKSIYSNYLLLEYNKCFAPYLLYECNCYNDYRENFRNVIYENGNSYLACIIIQVEDEYKILHKKWPIMLGSRIDFMIRGGKNDDNLFGCFIIDGVVKMIYNFITNNLTNGHVYRNRETKNEVFVVRLKANQLNLQLTYNPKLEEPISYTIYDELYEKNEKIKRKFEELQDLYNEELESSARKKLKLNNGIEKNYNKTKKSYQAVQNKSMINNAKNKTWIEFINDASVFKEKVFTEEEYIDYFKACLKSAPQLDELSNKTCLSPNIILLRVLEDLITKIKLDTTGATISKRLLDMSNKLTNIIKNGNMFYILSNKLSNDTNIMTEYKSIYQTVDAQKLHLVDHLSSTIKRSVNNRMINSKALLYPSDGFHFTCPIDIKDIKGAGENVSLAQLVISPKGLNVKILNEIFTKKADILNKLSGDDDELLTIVINSFLTTFTIAKSKLATLKSVCPILALMIYGKYLNLNTNGHVLMKYSLKYKFFITPYEASTIWTDAFDDNHEHLKYNPCVMNLTSYTDLAQPAKRNVANSNVKGRCNIFNSEFNIITFLHTIGASNAAILHKLEPGDETIEVSFTKHCKNKLKVPINLKNPHLRYLKYAETKNDVLPDILKEVFDQYKPIDDGSELNGLALDDIIDNSDLELKSMFNKIKKLYQDSYIISTKSDKIKACIGKVANKECPQLNMSTLNILHDNNASKNTTPIVSKNKNCFILGSNMLEQEYQKFLNFDTSVKNPSHFACYVAYGDIWGGTNEDGIIIDKSLVENGPKKLVSQTLNVKFSETVKTLKKNKISFVYLPQNTVCGNVITFGVVESAVKLSVIKSKNVKISETRLKNTFRYVIMTDLLCSYDKVIESNYCVENNCINIHVRYICDLGIGMKLFNLHGQKGIVSTIADLSFIKAYQRDGTIVHPQLLFSTTSVVGRTTSSQIMSMLSQEKLAFTEDGMLVAPQGINWHNIEASMKSKFSLVKNDLMTTENGFISNELNFTSKILKNQCPIEKNKHPLHLVQQLLTLQNVNLNFLSFDRDNIECIQE